MLNLNEAEEHYIELVKHIDFDAIDYNIIMREKAKHTYMTLFLASTFFIIGLVFFVAELIPKIHGIGVGAVSILLLLGLLCLFHALRYQKDTETRVTYEILQRIHAIEGHNGFLWRINTLINGYCQDEYGGLPNGIQQLQTSSQAGGIETDEIQLYKEVLAKVLVWYQKNKD